MNEEIYTKIAKDIKDVNGEIEKAKDLLKALRDVGKDTTVQERTLNELAREKVKWEKVLKSKGIQI